MMSGLNSKGYRYSGVIDLIDTGELVKYFKKKGINVKSGLHVTVIYSRAVYPLMVPIEVPIRIDSNEITGLDIFGDSLVLRFENDTIRKIHDWFISQSATWDFAEFKPHVTLMNGYKGGIFNISDFNLDLKLSGKINHSVHVS